MKIIVSVFLLMVSFCFLSTAKKTPAFTMHSLVFTQNKGQITDLYGRPRHDIDFKLGGSNVTVFIGNGQLHYQWTTKTARNSMTSYRMDVCLLGANPKAEIITEGKQAYFENYYLPQCVNGVTAHCYKKITYKNIYSNIDWEIETVDAGGNLKYNFIVHPGGDYRKIKLRFDGATSLALKDGALTAGTPMGYITENKPYTFDAATKKEIKSSFVLNDNILSYNISSLLGEGLDGTFVIDPFLQWSTYYGSNGSTGAGGIDIDQSGSIYMCGSTESTSNVATTGAFQTVLNGSSDGFIAKFTPTGNLVWATYYGGGSSDNFIGLKVFGSDIYVGGNTYNSTGLATTGSHQPTHGGGTPTQPVDGLLVKFNSQGLRQWATYYGGSNIDNIFGVTCDASGNVYIGGNTGSTSAIASVGASQSTIGGNQDYFVAKFNSSGVRQWGTYYGGIGLDNLWSICSDGTSIYVCGSSNSAGLGTSGTQQSTINGTTDALLVKFNSSGNKIWATYYGSVGVGTDAEGLTADASGNVYIAGNTGGGSGLSTTGCYQSSYGGGIRDGYIAKFNSSGQRVWGTYYGGAGFSGTADDAIFGLAFSSAANNLYVVGYSQTQTGLATSNAHQTVSNGGYEGILAVFDANGILQRSTYYGGSSFDVIKRACHNNAGRLYISGTTTSSTSIATAGTYQSTYGSGASQNGFLAAFVPDTAVFIRQPFYDTLFCAGDSIHIPDTVYYGFRSSNTFTVQLSNATGSFASPVNIGYANTGSSGVIHGVIPPGMAAGTGYRIRIVSTTPAFTSMDNGVDIHIKGGSVSFTATANTPVCASDTLRLYGTTTNPSSIIWHWSGPNSFTSSSKDTLIANAASVHAGDYILSANVQDGCLAKDTVTVVVKPMPAIPVAGGNTPICSGGTLNLSATSTTSGVSWNWVGPNTFTSSVQNPTINNIAVAGGGDYIVTSTLNGCSKKDTITIAVNQTPVKPNAGSNTPLCSGSTLNLTATSLTSSVTWSWTGPSFSSSLQNPSIANVQTTASGSYIVTATLGNCSSSDTEIVTINAGPVINIYPSPNDTICNGGSATLTAIPLNAGLGATFQWFKNGNLISGATNLTYNLSPNSGDVFYCRLMPGTGTGCTNPINSNSITLTVLPNLTPSVSVTANPAGPLAPFQLVTFTATPVNGGSTPQYQWTRNGTNVTGATASSWGATTLSDHDTICVWLTSSERCPSPKTVKSSNCITVTILTGVDDINNRAGIQLYPNPNDGHFTISIKESMKVNVSLGIYNAVGQQLRQFQCSTINGKLEQKISVDDLPDGLYIIKISAEDLEEKLRFTIRK